MSCVNCGAKFRGGQKLQKDARPGEYWYQGYQYCSRECVAEQKDHDTNVICISCDKKIPEAKAMSHEYFPRLFFCGRVCVQKTVQTRKEYDAMYFSGHRKQRKAREQLAKQTAVLEKQTAVLEKQKRTEKYQAQAREAKEVKQTRRAKCILAGAKRWLKKQLVRDLRKARGREEHWLNSLRKAQEYEILFEHTLPKLLADNEQKISVMGFALCKADLTVVLSNIKKTSADLRQLLADEWAKIEKLQASLLALA